MKMFAESIAPERITEQSALYALVSDFSGAADHIKVAHWNVRGANFLELHALYGEIYEFIGTNIDRLAERALVLNNDIELKIHYGEDAVVARGTDIDVVVDILDKLHTICDRYSGESTFSMTTQNIFAEIAEELGLFIWKLKSSR